MIRAAEPASLLVLIGGFIVWSVAFVALYVLLSIGCRFGWDAMPAGPLSVQRLVLLATWAVHLVGLLAMLAWLRPMADRWRSEEGELGRFMALTALALTIAAIVATLWSFAGIVGLSTCR